MRDRDGLFKKVNSKFWYLGYQGPDGKRIQRSSRTACKSEAAAMLHAIRTDIRRGEYRFMKRVGKRISFKEAKEAYIAHEAAEIPPKRTARKELSTLKNLEAYLGGKSLSEIMPRMIEEYRKHRKRVVSEVAVNRECAALKHLFNVSRHTLGFDGPNPVSSKPYRELKREAHIPSRKEEQAILQAAAPIIRPIMVVGLHAGMRLSEVTSLRWDQVDFKERAITLFKTKSKKPHIVPMDETVIKALRGLKRTSEYVFPGFKDPSRPIASIKRPWERARKAAGLSDFRFHDFRHNFASTLADNGCHPFTLQDMLGHEDVRTTQRYYDATLQSKLRAVKIMDEAFGPKRKRTRIHRDTQVTPSVAIPLNASIIN